MRLADLVAQIERETDAEFAASEPEPAATAKPRWARRATRSRAGFGSGDGIGESRVLKKNPHTKKRFAPT